ncbi:hypothetical protein HII31_10470 [Pseudocercospora fuligena]|uniref:Azaphilone pigments biosynthesis cluster protein L N-terminal domain-containing protein n=1 Tax=Pseudocercospora fuligena TaxID=685502 RepID=A0A8H6VEB5_9PEZI|nr:hypothetical protein HII31_10470 [Pseudocercospora fuligena]
MAEVFGTVASILQVAEVGFSLATTLYSYAASVKGAEKEIKKIARDVRLTSKVLTRTHEQLKADRNAQLATDEALQDLEDVLDGCKEAFQEVDEVLNKSLKPGAGGKPSISTFDKFRWPLRTNRLEVLRANLEKLKTTLLLMLSVLAYGSKVSQQHRQPDVANIKVEQTLDKLQLHGLAQAKDEATQRFEQLSAAFQKLETGINASQPTYASPLPGNGMNSMLAVDPQTHVPAPGTTAEIPSTARCLEACANAVLKLTSSIDVATKRWEANQTLEHVAIKLALDDTTKAVALLQSSGNLADYQLRLILLEEQNKKGLLLARKEQEARAGLGQSADPHTNQMLRSAEQEQVVAASLSSYQQSQRPTSRFMMQQVTPQSASGSRMQQVTANQPQVWRQAQIPYQHVVNYDFGDLGSPDNLDNLDFDSFLEPFLESGENAAGTFDFSGVELENVSSGMTFAREEVEADGVQRRSSKKESTIGSGRRSNALQDKDGRKFEVQADATSGDKSSDLMSLDLDPVQLGYPTSMETAATGSATAALVADFDLSEYINLDELEGIGLDLGDPVDTEDDDVAVVNRLLKRWTKIAA